jgi:hypothetical protein
MSNVWDELAGVRASLRWVVLQALAWQRANPYHDAEGKFTTKGGVGGGSAAPVNVQNVQLSRHAFQRMKERKKFQSVHTALQQLRQVAVPNGEWHMAVRRGNKVDCYLAGNDGVVKTVLGGWYNSAKLGGVAVGG